MGEERQDVTQTIALGNRTGTDVTSICAYCEQRFTYRHYGEPARLKAFCSQSCRSRDGHRRGVIKVKGKPGATRKTRAAE